MEIKKKALEDLIEREIQDITLTTSMLASSRFAIECGDGYEVQVMITNNEDEFCGKVIDPYDAADV